MKKLIIIFSLLGIGICSFGQVVEKWVDTDSLDAEKIVLNGNELNASTGPVIADTNFVNTKVLENDSVIYSQKSDTSNFAFNSDSSTISDTSLFLLQSIISAPDTIFVEITGSDVTGDGTILNPYATINGALTNLQDIINNAGVQIQLGAGTFAYTRADRKLIRERKIYGEEGRIFIVGNFTDSTGLTFIQRATDPFIYDYNGASLGWTPDEFKYSYFAQYTHTIAPNNKYILTPIVSNGADWVEVATPNLITDNFDDHLCILNTTLDLSDFVAPKDPYPFSYALDKLDVVIAFLKVTSHFHVEFNNAISIYGVSFQASSRILKFNSPNYNCSVNGIAHSGRVKFFKNVNVNGLFVNATGYDDPIQCWYKSNIHCEDVSIVGRSTSNAIIIQDASSVSIKNMKINTAENAFQFLTSGGDMKIDKDAKYSFVDVDYIAEDLSTGNISMIFPQESVNIFGNSPVIDFWNPASLDVSHIDIEKGKFISYPGIDPTITFKDSDIDTIMPDTIPNKEYVDSYFSGSLTDGAPTASEINSITGLTPSTAGYNRQLLIFDTDGTGLFYKILSNGTSWIYFPGQSGSTAL